MNKRVSLKDVAAKAGVSTALVSYVLNGKQKEARVGEVIAKKIKQIAKELNYQPNLIAKSLKSGQTQTLGLIVADISNSFFSSLAKIIEIEAGKNGYTVLFGSSDEDLKNSQNLINTFLNRQVDGLIITPVQGSEAQILDLQQKNIPFVLMDRTLEKYQCNHVIIDNYQAAYQATELLYDNGYRRIAMIAYDTKLMHMQERIKGYKEALKKNAGEPSQLIKVNFDNMQKQVEKEIYKLLVVQKKIDAFMFATNSISIEALKIIHKLKIRVPDDLGIVSFDESDAFDFFYSPVTYIKQNMQLIGENVVKVLVKNINNKDNKLLQVVIPASIVVRESSGR